MSETAGRNMLLSPLSPSSASGSSASRPVKLRTACNQCCAAKVKCSGDRSGCERCQNMGTRCVYLESRVGKVPGVRAKKRRIQHEQHQSPPTHQSNYHIPQTSLPPLSNASSPVLTLLDHGTHDETMQWATNSQLDSTETSCELLDTLTGSTTDAAGSSDSIIASSTIDDFMPSVNLDLDDLWTSPLPQEPIQHNREVAPAPLPVAESTQKIRQENDSRCVMQCCQLISDLETYIAADMEAFQIRLGIARKANGKLNELIAMQQESRNMRCLLLFSTTCYQVIELLNLCHKTISSPESCRRSASFLVPSGLGFGDLGFDEEERLAWQAQRIVKEVNQVGETVRKVKLLAGVGPEQPTSSASSTAIAASARAACYHDLDCQVKDLVAKVTAKM